MCVLTVRKSVGTVVELVEGEGDIINMNRVEGSMAAVVNSLKHEYTTNIVARITPGQWCHCWDHTMSVASFLGSVVLCMGTIEPHLLNPLL